MLKATQIHALSSGMAAALRTGPWDAESMNARLADALDRPWPWCGKLVNHLLTAYASPPPYEELVSTIIDDAVFHAAVNNRTRPRIVHWLPSPVTMCPAFPEWELPRIDTEDDLGKLLEVTHAQLIRLADREHRRMRPGDGWRNHYRTYWLHKPSGGWRLVEAPRTELKTVQRSLLHHVFDRVPPHPAACAYVRGRSIVDYASPHTGKEIVLHLDLKDFFPSVTAAQVRRTVSTLGYTVPVARLMTGLCTTVAPARICRRYAGGRMYSAPHLPQGAPTSPALANLAAYRLDCRLAAATREAGGSYTRYADDLAFSGGRDFARSAERFLELVWKIVGSEGLGINHRKTHVMHRSVRQRLCGLVVNDHLNIDRRDYDRLKAILTNCVRHGLDSQNRDHHPYFREHLRGRVNAVEQVNPRHGSRLRELFDRIAS